jgi:hypothetical protein
MISERNVLHGLLPEVNKWHSVLMAPDRRATFRMEKGQLLMTVVWNNPNLRNEDVSAGDVWLQWSEVFKNNNPADYTVPILFNDTDKLKNRNLNISWEKGLESQAIYSRLLDGLNMFVKIAEPDYKVISLRKIYPVTPHIGIYPENKTHPLDADEAYVALNEFDQNIILDNKPVAGGMWGGISLVPTGEHGVNQNFVIPMADLDFNFGDENGGVNEKIRRISEILAHYGFSGYLIRSGRDVQYLGDFILPGYESAWKYLAKLMDILTSDKNSEIHQIAETLANSQNMLEAQEVAEKLLLKYPSDKPTGSLLDVRWVGHALTDNNGNPYLRYSKGKYPFKPYSVAQIS